jgi:hypothetical protein
MLADGPHHFPQAGKTIRDIVSSYVAHPTLLHGAEGARYAEPSSSYPGVNAKSQNVGRRKLGIQRMLKAGLEEFIAAMKTEPLNRIAPLAS